VYDDIKHWVEMDNPLLIPSAPHTIPYQEESLIKFLNTIQFKSVLDVGASTGRIAQLIFNNFDVETYHGVDLSIQRLQCAKSVTEKYKGVGVGPDIEFYGCSYYDFRPEQKYDLVIATEVLMHIPPPKLETFFGKMVKESKNHVISLDYYPIPFKAIPNLADHNFLHRYPDLYIKNGFHRCQEIRVSDLQSMFHGQKE